MVVHQVVLVQIKETVVVAVVQVILVAVVAVVIVAVTVLVEQVVVDQVLFLVRGQILYPNKDKREQVVEDQQLTTQMLITLRDMVEVVKEDWWSSLLNNLTPQLESVIISR